MNIFEEVMKFYQDYKEVALLIIGGLLTLVLTKLIPYLGSLIHKAIDWAIRKIGGRISFHTIEGKYLNWVVLHNQDLNLTGIIGAGQKPKLEQIFISLNVTKGLAENKENKPDSVEIEKQKSQWNIFQQKIGDYWQKRYRNLRDFISKLIVTRAEDKSLIFNPSRIWKLKQFLDRDNIDITSAICIVVILPCIILYFIRHDDGFLYGISAFFLSLIVTAALTQLANITKFADLFDWNYAFGFWLPSLAIFGKLAQILSLPGNPLPIFFISGLILGAGFAIYVQRDQLFPRHHSERQAKEVGDLISKYEHIAILGKPGSGKSTYLQFIALTFAQERANNSRLRKSNIARRRFGISNWYLPILIPLRKVSNFINVSSVYSGKNLCIEAFRQEVLPSDLGDDFSDAFVRYMLRNKRCILLLDGLDEVASENEFNIIVNEIKGLVAQYPGNKFIITSRYMGWRGGVGSAFQETEVNDLTNKQISSFAYSWYNAIEKNQTSSIASNDSDEQKFLAQRAEIKAEQLVKTIRTVDSIKNLAKTPLLLSMICFVHYNKTLPKERISLYEDCSQLLLEQWDVEKGLPQDDIPLSFSRKEIVMEEIAYAIHSGYFQNGIGAKEASGKEIIRTIEETLKKFDIESIQAETFFRKLTSRTGLIVSTEKYKDLYGFSHLTFQEFYAAKYLHRNKIDIISTIAQGGPSEESASSWWREVIVLYSGMQKEASELIHELCRGNEDDLLNNRIQIAAQCLLDTIETPSPIVERELLDELIKIRSTRKLSQGHSAEQLSKAGRDYLLKFATSDEFYERSLITAANEAIENGNVEKIIEQLSRLLLSKDNNVRIAATKTIMHISQMLLRYDMVDQIVLNSILEKADLDFEIYNILDYVAHQEEKSEELLNRTIKDIVKPLYEDLLDSPSLATTMIMDKTLDLLATTYFENIHYELKALSIENLRKILDSKTKPSKLFSQGSKRQNFSRLMKFILDLDSQPERQIHQKQLQQMLIKGNINQQIWAIYLIADIFNQNNSLIAEVLQKLQSPNSDIRASAISVVHKLGISDVQLDEIRKKLRSTLDNKHWLVKVGMQTLQLLFGIGALGITEAERIQIAGMLVATDKTKTSSLKKFSDLVPISNLYQFRFEWSLLLSETKGKLSQDDIEYVFDEISKILTDENKDETFLGILFLDLTEPEVDSNIKDKFIDLILNTQIEKEGAFFVVSFLHPSLSLDNKHFEKIKNALSHESYEDSNAAYEILEKNNLLNQVLYSK